MRHISNRSSEFLASARSALLLCLASPVFAAQGLTVEAALETPQSMQRARVLMQQTGMSLERIDRGRQYFLVMNDAGRWQPRLKADVSDPRSERVWVSMTDHRVYLLVEEEPYTSRWCLFHRVDQRKKDRYTACSSRFTRLGELPSQRREVDGRMLALVNREALAAAVEEANLETFIAQDLEDEPRRHAEFRRQLKLGDETNLGMVTEVKPPLVKIQSSDVSFGERWFRIDEIFPRK
jgi:hypothetical protein